MADIRRADVTVDAIDVDALASLVADDHAGAIVTFCGNVRNQDGGRDVVSLLYEAHPSAQHVVEEVAARMLVEHPLVIAMAVVHRVGLLDIGDTAFAVAVSAAHRDAAFAACSATVDTVKELLPVWKHQTFADGTDEWVNWA